MLINTFKRKTKEKCIKTTINQNKTKINNTTIVRTFNRLILDANRRLKAIQNLDFIKQLLTPESKYKGSRKFKTNDWENYYNRSVRNYSENKKKKLQDMKEKINSEEKLKEDKIIKELKVKKAPQIEIERIIQRVYTIRKSDKINKLKYSCIRDHPRYNSFNSNLKSNHLYTTFSSIVKTTEKCKNQTKKINFVIIIIKYNILD